MYIIDRQGNIPDQPGGNRMGNICQEKKQNKGEDDMKKFFSALCDVVGFVLMGKSYLIEKYTKKELAEMGVKFDD